MLLLSGDLYSDGTLRTGDSTWSHEIVPGSTWCDMLLCLAIIIQMGRYILAS
jgi:hypothetical protein